MRSRGCFCRKDVARRVPRAVWKFPPCYGAPRSSVLGPRWGQRDLVSCRSQLQPALWAEAIPTVPSNSQPFFPPPQYPCQPGAPCRLWASCGGCAREFLQGIAAREQTAPGHAERAARSPAAALLCPLLQAARAPVEGRTNFTSEQLFVSTAYNAG